MAGQQPATAVLTPFSVVLHVVVPAIMLPQSAAVVSGWSGVCSGQTASYHNLLQMAAQRSATA